jgi:hypothetical protein
MKEVIRMRTVGSALCLILLLTLSACQGYGAKGIPEELCGVWESEAQNYERCSLEITGKRLIFENGVRFIDINYVTKVEQAKEGNTPLYTIHYENRSGDVNKVSVLYMKKEQGDMLRFKHQKNVFWTKRVGA